MEYTIQSMPGSHQGDTGWKDSFHFGPHLPFSTVTGWMKGNLDVVILWPKACQWLPVVFRIRSWVSPWLAVWQALAHEDPTHTCAPAKWLLAAL